MLLGKTGLYNLAIDTRMMMDGWVGFGLGLQGLRYWLRRAHVYMCLSIVVGQH